MLKRQRASSPIPGSPIISQDKASEGIIDIRDLKRRRVALPSLDGQTRELSHTNSIEEDCEEDIVGDEGDVGSKAKTACTAQRNGNAEYAAVNSVLKEIHILHKHRQIFLPHPANTSQLYPPQFPFDKNQISLQEGQTSSEESVRVFEHYEGTNRYLASAFLSRRQHSSGQP